MFMARRLAVTLVLVAICAAKSLAQEAPKPVPPPAEETMGKIFDRQLSMVEREFVSAAEAMPEKDFFWAPTAGEFKGVRNFGQQIGHVAAENLAVAESMLGEPSTVTDEDRQYGPKTLKTKADYVDYLRKSFAMAHRAASSITPANATERATGNDNRPKLALANELLWHSFDHYGQMVVYLRSRGIVPPASRPKQQ
jgi:uncharacterized damage-inducible protein DinB